VAVANAIPTLAVSFTGCPPMKNGARTAPRICSARSTASRSVASASHRTMNSSPP
jgi:hypothetical protein